MPDKYDKLIGEATTIHELKKIMRTFGVNFEPAVRRIIHDWEKWPSALLVRIESRGGNLKIDCFRGIHRKKRSPESPTSTELSNLLVKKTSPWEIKSKLTEVFKLDKDSMTNNTMAVWAIL